MISIRRTADLLFRRFNPSVGRVIRYGVARNAADHVSVNTITVHVGPAAGERVPLRLVYQLVGLLEHGGKRLVLFNRLDFLTIVSAECTAGCLEPTPAGLRKPNVLCSFVPTSGTWHGATVTITAEWAPERTQGLLPVPGALPSVLRRSVEETRPAVRVVADGSNGVVVGGLMRERHKPFDPTDDLIEAVLVWKATLGHRRFALAPALCFELGDGRDAFLEGTCLELEHLEMLLGPVGSRFTWLSGGLAPRSPDVSCGCYSVAILTRGPQASGRNAKKSALLSARELTALWWEGGCRFVGRHRYLLERGLQFYTNLRLFSIYYPQAMGAVARGYRVLAESSRSTILRQWLTYDAVPRARAARLSLALHDATESDPRLPDVIRQIVDDGWGHYVSAGATLKLLADAGVDLKGIGI